MTSAARQGDDAKGVVPLPLFGNRGWGSTAERTQLAAEALEFVVLGRQVVDDWRNTDHAWVASTSALYQLPAQLTTTAGSDAADAGWYPFDSLERLEAAITAAGRSLYAAHRPLLQDALTYVNC